LISDQESGSEYSFGVKCKDSDSEIKGIIYKSSTQEGDTTKEYTYSESAFMKPLELDNIPKVFFRLSRPLKDGAVLPIIDLD
jgi:hypothetical protein